MAAVTICSDFGAQKNKVWHWFHCFPIYFQWKMGPDAMIFIFWMLSFKPTVSLSSFTFIKRLFSSSSLLPEGWCHLHIWGFWYFSWKSWFFYLFVHLEMIVFQFMMFWSENYIMYLERLYSIPESIEFEFCLCSIMIPKYCE